LHRSDLRSFVACAPLALFGCQSIIGADFASARERVADAGVRREPDAAVACVLHEPPVHPLDLPPATDSVDFTVVIDQLDFGDEDLSEAGAPPAVGYDLDGVCTEHEDMPSCTAYPWIHSTVLDGPGGRDDAVGNLFKAQKRVFGGALISTEEENEGVVAGLAAPPGILRIRGFSGLASDDHVVVELFQAGAFDLNRRSGQLGDAGVRPAFDASDHWPLVRDTLLNPDGMPLESSQRDDHAFVMDSMLVAHFDRLQLPMHNIYVDTSKAVITGHLAYSAVSGWTVRDGTMAARIRTDFLLGFVPLATQSAVGISLCTNDALNYQAAKTALCSAADLPAVDGDPTSACTYASLGVGFQSSPASLGPIIDVPPPASRCPPETDPARDTCATQSLIGSDF
jgi:hypothetical protein